MNKSTRKYIQCSCGAEILVLEKFEDELVWCFSIFTYLGYAGLNQSIWDRVRGAFHLLFKGYFWTDEMVLDADSIKELRDYLDEELNNVQLLT